MYAKCKPISRSMVAAQLTPYEVVQMLNFGYRLDAGQISEAGVRRADAEGDNESRWTRMVVPRS